MNPSRNDLEPRRLRALVGTAAIAAPGLHILSDLIEWLQRGFSPLQLWMTYAAFVAMPPLFLGLWAVQRRMRWIGLVGALLYGVAFVYFAHSALFPLEEHVADYATAWRRLGPIYTLHGGLMIAGGLMFGVATLRARVLPQSTALMFIGGLSLNLLLFVVRAPESLQPIGSIVRNAGLIGMGVTLLRGADHADPSP